MIVEAAILGASSVIISSLWLTDRVLKREHEDDIDEEIKIKPYQKVIVGCACQICGQITRVIGIEGSTIERGISKVPQACKKPNECPAKQSHLHVHCASCDSTYFMATKPEGL